MPGELVIPASQNRQADRPSTFTATTGTSTSPTTPTATTPTAELIEMAKLVAASHLIPGVDTPPAAFTLMLICQAQGLHPGEALTRFHIINDRPVMRADAMQAEFQRRGGIIQWKEWTREVCRAIYLHPTHAPEPGIEIITTLAEMMESGEAMQWDKEAANEKGSKGKMVLKTNYRTMPHKMLRARNISEGVRMVLPGVVVGIYTPEEAEDIRREATTAPKVVQARVIHSRVVQSSADSASTGNGASTTSQTEGQTGGVSDPAFAAKVAASQQMGGIIRPDSPAPPANYTIPDDPIRDDQKAKINHLVKEVLKLSRENWQAILLPYQVSSLGQLTAIDAASIISNLEVRADGDPFGPAGVAPGTLRDDDPRLPLYLEALDLVGRLEWDDKTLEIITLAHYGVKTIEEMNQDMMAQFVSALKVGELSSNVEVPDTTRPIPVKSRGKKVKEVRADKDNQDNQGDQSGEANLDGNEPATAPADMQ